MIQKIPPYFLLFILSIPLLFGIGNVHLFDWDEINFAECAREMIVSGNWLIPQIKFEPFWEKPPLFFWMQAASMTIFGVNEFAARLPNALFGFFTLVLLYEAGKIFYNKQFGFYWALIYISSIFPFIYFKSGIIDPVFNFFIFLSFILFIHAIKKSYTSLFIYILAGVINGFAILTKGPVGLLLPVLGILISGFYYRKIFFKQLFIYSLSAVFIAATWYAVWIFANGWNFFLEFINYQISLLQKPVAGHEQFLLYHFLIVFFGCFPLSIFAIGKLFSKIDLSQNPESIFMRSLFWVVLIIFTIVTTKIAHYSSLSYLPLSFFATQFLVEKINNNQKSKSKIWSLYLIIGFIWFLLVFVLFYFKYFTQFFTPNETDRIGTFIFQSIPFQMDVFNYITPFVFLFGILLSYLLFKRKKIKHGIIVQYINIVLLISILQFTLLPKIESVTQGNFIQIIQEMKSKNLPLYCIGFKSYAPYFYGEINLNYISKVNEIHGPHAILTKINTNKPSFIPMNIEPQQRGIYLLYIIQ